MAYSSLPLMLLAITPLLLLLTHQTLAQSPLAPAPSPSGPVNLTGILNKAGQYTTFIRLLTSNQIDKQIENQLNTSTDGMTVFAPTDNAFNNLKAGALNDLTQQEQIQLILYHVLPKYYTLTQLLTVSNPVSTQGTGNDGVWGLNFTGEANQVNVSTGIVETQINNALRQESPLAVYEVDKVLLPIELFGAKPPASSPPAKTPSSGSNSTKTTAEGPSLSSTKDGSGSVGRNVGSGLILALGLICMGALL